MPYYDEHWAIEHFREFVPGASAMRRSGAVRILNGLLAGLRSGTITAQSAPQMLLLNTMIGRDFTHAGSSPAENDSLKTHLRGVLDQLNREGRNPYVATFSVDHPDLGAYISEIHLVHVDPLVTNGSSSNLRFAFATVDPTVAD